MKKANREAGILETLIGVLMDALPIVCAFFIVTWAGAAYTEGYGLFVQKGMDRSGSAHTEIVEVTEEEASSALAVGRVLEKQDLIRSRFAFAIKSKLSGYDGLILPGQYVLSSDMTAEEILQKISTKTAKAGTESGGAAAGGEDEQEEGSRSRESDDAEKENKDVWGQY